MNERKTLLPESPVQSKLKLWQERLGKAKADYSAEESKMDERERLYNGKRELTPLVQGDTKKDGSHKETSHVRNIVFENIESMISANIPTPKVAAQRTEPPAL